MFAGYRGESIPTELRNLFINVPMLKQRGRFGGEWRGGKPGFVLKSSSVRNLELSELSCQNSGFVTFTSKILEANGGWFHASLGERPVSRFFLRIAWFEVR